MSNIFLNRVCMHAQLCPIVCNPWTVAHQAPLSMDFSRQGYWGRLPFPMLGDLPNPGLEPASLVSPALTGRFFTNWTTWEALLKWTNNSEGLSVNKWKPLSWEIKIPRRTVIRMSCILLKLLETSRRTFHLCSSSGFLNLNKRYFY